MSDQLPDTVSASALADVCGVTEKTIRNWSSAGLIEKASRGQYALDLSTLISYMSDQSGENDRSPAHRKILAQAQREELRLAREKEQVVPWSEVVAGWKKLSAHVSTMVQAIPARLTGMDASLSSRQLALIEQELKAVLEEYAESGKEYEDRE